MKRSGFQIMARLIGLVKPLTGYMILAITMGLIGHLCAAFITVFGGYAILHVLHPEWSMSLGVLFGAVLIFALVRGFLRYAEQACNHFIAFKLLALIRDKVFGALRRLCPAKLEGKDKGNIVESGNQKKLLEANSSYAKLWNAQQELENYTKGGVQA